MSRYLGDDQEAPTQVADTKATKTGRPRGGGAAGGRGGKTGRPGGAAAAPLESGGADSPAGSAGAGWKAEAARVLERLTKSRSLCEPFMDPVDPVALGLPDYLDVVKTPMDLGTVRRRLAEGEYAGPGAFLREAALVFDNAMAYNPDDSRVHRQAAELRARLAQACEASPALRAAAARGGSSPPPPPCRYFSEEQGGAEAAERGGEEDGCGESGGHVKEEDAAEGEGAAGEGRRGGGGGAGGLGPGRCDAVAAPPRTTVQRVTEAILSKASAGGDALRAQCL
jgi:hypothetical protein